MQVRYFIRSVGPRAFRPASPRSTLQPIEQTRNARPDLAHFRAIEPGLIRTAGGHAELAELGFGFAGEEEVFGPQRHVAHRLLELACRPPQVALAVPSEHCAEPELSQLGVT